MVFFCIVCLLWALWASLFHYFSLATGNLLASLRPPFLGQLRMRQRWILDKKRLYNLCIETTSICLKTTCIETTLYRNDRKPRQFRGWKITIEDAVMSTRKYASVSFNLKSFIAVLLQSI